MSELMKETRYRETYVYPYSIHQADQKVAAAVYVNLEQWVSRKSFYKFFIKKALYIYMLQIGDVETLRNIQSN